MSEGLNRATLIGNVGNDPELRYTASNRAVLKFRIATTESYVTDSGERKDNTQWHNIVLWGKRAEALSKFLAKGKQVYVEGRIENRSYDDKDGVKRYTSEVSVINIILLGGPRSDSGGAPAPRQERAPGPKHQSDDAPPADDFGGGSADDDIPFNANRFESR